MRVLIGGKGWLAVRTARLLARLADIRAFGGAVEVVRNRDDDGVDSWLPSLVSAAVCEGWRVHDSIEEAAPGPGDRFLSLQHDRIIDCAVLGAGRGFNLHFAKLPDYRGSLTSYWPIRCGEVTAGVTLHELAPAVDAGPIIASREFPLPPFYSAYDLYRTYHDYGFELVKEHLPALLARSYRAVAQDDTKATTYTRRSVDFSAVSIGRFDRSAEAVRDHCRSLIFPPRQHPRFRGRHIRGCYAIDWPGAPAAAPGTVLSDDRHQAIVACQDGMVCFEYVPHGRRLPEQH